MNESEIVSQLEHIRSALHAVQTSPSRTNTGSTEGIMRSSADNIYVNVFSSPYFYWEKCFPTLYPYGRGGPSDPYYRIESLETYFKHVLRRGGGKYGRRFQNNSNHIFVSYAYVTRNRIKNMAYAATRNDSAASTKELTSQAVVSTLVDCLAQSAEDEPLDIDVLYERQKQRRNVSKDEEGNGAHDEMVDSPLVRNDTEMLDSRISFCACFHSLHVFYSNLFARFK